MSGPFVYFIKPVGLTGPIKIGYSYAPLERLRSLSTWSPFPLEVLAMVPGKCSLEFKVHNCFADLHSHHEWFIAAPRLIEAIDKIKAGVPIEVAIDLENPVGKVRSRQRPSWTPSRRLCVSYLTRFRHLEGKRFWIAPKDANAILARWNGLVADAAHPTPTELARLDEILAAPSVHCKPNENRGSAP